MNKGLPTIEIKKPSDWRRLHKPLAAALMCAVLVPSLQGCAGVLLGGAVVGTLAATDRRTLGAQTEDKAIVVKAQTRANRLVGQEGNVNVNSFNRRVLLTGEVKDEATKAAVEQEVGTVENVQSVINELEIAGPSSFTSRSNDALITGKIKAAFVDAKDIFANSVKVVTERGNVYLMGRVTQAEGARAAEIARNVSGVQRIIKVFEYLTEDELRQLSTLQQ